jgi:hypothetical protein
MMVDKMKAATLENGLTGAISMTAAHFSTTVRPHFHS